MRRKEGYLSHSFRPEEAIRLMALTLRVNRTSGCRAGHFPSLLPQLPLPSLLYCPLPALRVQPGPNP